MAVAAETMSQKTRLIAEFRRQENDTGSPEIQVALLTHQIAQLTEHLRAHRHDFASQRGLLKMVGQRSRLLKYLSRENLEGYQALIKRLGLRK